MCASKTTQLGGFLGWIHCGRCRRPDVYSRQLYPGEQGAPAASHDVTSRQYQDRALTSEQAIRLFNTYGASLPLIRKHREAYEQYEEETQLRENLLNLIETSLSNESGADLAADNDVKPIILGNLGNRMPQIAQLPAVRAFFRTLNDNYDRDADDAVEPESDDWGARWPEIRKDLEQLQEQCEPFVPRL